MFDCTLTEVEVWADKVQIIGILEEIDSFY